MHVGVGDAGDDRVDEGDAELDELALGCHSAVRVWSGYLPCAAAHPLNERGSQCQAEVRVGGDQKDLDVEIDQTPGDDHEIVYFLLIGELGDRDDDCDVLRVVCWCQGDGGLTVVHEVGGEAWDQLHRLQTETEQEEDKVNIILP